ncbi:MAG: ankyrin repeat domain-containing protein [Sterolibacteriaceae bacterium MAG5]|nr:ankyrin repeat domain-containing protein [Candidatus Nitricoxidireducens bremensis]
MARIPSFEEILLEIHQSLGLERRPSKFVGQFSDLGMSLDRHQEMAEELLNEIFGALDMDCQAREDTKGNLFEWGNFHKALELHTWTGPASQQQVVWHLLAYSYVPALARRLAFWELANVEEGVPALDAGMPGGLFWFFPQWHEASGKATMPVTQVIDWLLDLLGEQSLGDAGKSLGNANLRQEGASAAVRTLHNWRKGITPKNAASIDTIFPDDAELRFDGAFTPIDGLAPAQEFDAALAFVREKGLNAESLSWEIPMKASRLEPIFLGEAAEEEKMEFVRRVAIRYAPPDMRTIRLRLKVARMGQDAYERLVKFLCPDVDPSCADPKRNKMRQLVGLFEGIYNLTIQAWHHGNTYAEQDVWFEAQLPPWDKETLFLSILPSRRETAYEELAHHLIRRFFELRPDDPLPDMWPTIPDDAPPIFEHRLRLLKRDAEELLRIEQLKERVRTASPWPTLQAENSYWVISQFAQDAELPMSMRGMAVQRMRELAATEGEKSGSILIELGNLFDCPPKQRPPGMRERVAALLSEVEESPSKDIWTAPLLRMRAKHKLALDDIEGAAKDLRAALDACSEYSYGSLRGDIAYEAWAADLAQGGRVPGSHEKLYRNILGYMEFPNRPPAFEDAGVQCEEFFWNTLYRPYPGVERREPPANNEFEPLHKGTFDLIAKADWEALRALLTRHARKLKGRQLPEARRNSVLMLWMKFVHGLESAGADTQSIMPPEFAAEFSKLDTILANWHQAIRILLEVWPEQAGIPDFKGQTPLMLAADHGDAELVTLLLANKGCDVNAQDYLGRTALHVAVTGQSAKCVAAVLGAGPNPYKATQDEQNTALHTAVRMGDPNIARLILNRFSKLGTQPNEFGRTALDIALDYLNDYDGFEAFMRNQHGRRIGSRTDFEHLVSLLSESTA